MREKICEMLAKGYSMTDIARLPDMPTRESIWHWCYKDDSFFQAVEKAREFGMHAFTEKLNQAIEDAELGPGELAKLKIKADHMRWFIGKINQRKYGERTTIAGDKDNPLTLNIASALDARIAAARAAPVIEHAPVVKEIAIHNSQTIDDE